MDCTVSEIERTGQLALSECFRYDEHCSTSKCGQLCKCNDVCRLVLLKKLDKLDDDDVILQLLYLTLCAEPETQEAEGATKQKDSTGSYELQQQLKEAKETIATLREEVNRLQQLTSELSIVLRRLCNNQGLFVACRNFRKRKFLEEFFNIVRQGIFLQFRSYL